jgi:hypothetical protein
MSCVAVREANGVTAVSLGGRRASVGDNQTKGSDGTVKHVRILGLTLLACIALTALMASSALAIKAGTKSPKIFENCNTKATEDFGEGSWHSRVGGIQCIVAATETGAEAGSYTVGGITVPFSKQVVLQYAVGFFENPAEERKEGFIAPINGAPAIAPTPEKVPGEPIANISAAEQEELGWPETLKYSYKQAQKHHEVKSVYETIELAGIPATNRANLAAQEGTAVEAPIMIKGENKWIAKLGDDCYIGSEEDPIVQHLTSGSIESPLTHEVLTGSVGSLEFYPPNNGDELIINHSDLVDNTYAVPAAKCTGPYSSYIAATINKIFNIPQPAGASVTQLKGTLWDGYYTYVEEKLNK